MEPINIKETYKYIDLLIAQKCDDGDGLLEEEKGEVSIFNKAQKEFQESGKKQEVTINGIRYHYDNILNKLVQLKESFMEQNTSNEEQAYFNQNDEIPEILKANDSQFITETEAAIKCASQENLNSIENANIRQVVINQLVKRCPGISKLEDYTPAKKREEMEAKVDYVVEIVTKLCNKYRIDELAPVVADMLGNETGGYVFSSRVLKHPGSKYKGCMQVDFLTCQCIFSEGPSKNKAWHNAHFAQDDERIEELRAKYKNANNLYAAIQTDVELGLEVGTIAFKAKLHESKGSVNRAIAKYCGSQYKFPHTKYPEVPTQFDLV